jgi:Zn-dependent protease
MGRGSIQLGRVFGIRIGASASWFVFLFFLIFSLSGYFRDVLPDRSNTTSYLIAVAAALLFFVSLVLHELGHALVARRSGIAVEGIDLWFFGGLAKINRDSDTPGEEFRIAAAGPAVTLLIVAVCLGIAALTGHLHGVRQSAELRDQATTPAIALLGWLALVNLGLFLFNMVPAFPLDGGRIARAIAWKVTGDRNRGTRFSARLGQGFAYVLMGLGAVSLLTQGGVFGLWWVFLGWFLLQAARGAVLSSRFADRIAGVTAGDVMEEHPLSVPDDLTLLQAHDRFFAPYRLPFVPVIDEFGRYLGLLRQERIDSALQAGTPALSVREALASEPAEDSLVSADTPLEALLSSEPLRRLGALAVVDRDGRLCGLITLDRLGRALGTVGSP